MNKMKKVFFDVKSNCMAALILLIIIIIGASSIFSLREYEKAAAYHFGEFSRSYIEPGLHFKWPWPFETVNRLDTRLQLYEGKPTVIKEKNKKNLLVDPFLLWKPINPNTFFTKLGGNMTRAIHRLEDHTGAVVNRVLGSSNFDAIVTTNRQEILDTIKAISNDELKDIDLVVALFSFNRVELPSENQQSVFERMVNERNKVVKGIDADGERIYKEITSDADFTANDIRNNAKRMSDSIKGVADEKALAILNNFAAKSKPLFELQNKIETFKKSYGENTEWILDGKEILAHPK
jgi:membrane protease subunit HflC